MCDIIQIFPETLRTGAPITAKAHAHERTLPKTMTVRPLEQTGVEAFTVPLKVSDGHLEGQFSVSFPGKFEISMGSFKRRIDVEAQRDLSFQAEFGFFSLVVAFCVGGMIVWLKKQKSTAGSAFPSGPS